MEYLNSTKTKLIAFVLPHKTEPFREILSLMEEFSYAYLLLNIWDVESQKVRYAIVGIVEIL